MKEGTRAWEQNWRSHKQDVRNSAANSVGTQSYFIKPTIYEEFNTSFDYLMFTLLFIFVSLVCVLAFLGCFTVINFLATAA